jgi:microtubule-associated protein, RP/EB family
MMDAAYFVGRKELLDFVNDTLGLKLQKIEQTASGAVACQLFDIMYPGSIAMAKVNWAARSDYEFIQNYKILQGGFNKHHVQRHVDVDKVRHRCVFHRHALNFTSLPRLVSSMKRCVEI